MAAEEWGGGSVMRTSYSADFMARIESVVQAIQPQPGSSRLVWGVESGVEAARALEARRSSSRRGISCTPIQKRGRRRCGGAEEERRSVTARGMLERTERSYTRIISLLKHSVE